MNKISGRGKNNKRKNRLGYCGDRADGDYDGATVFRYVATKSNFDFTRTNLVPAILQVCLFVISRVTTSRTSGRFERSDPRNVELDKLDCPQNPLHVYPGTQ